MSPKKIRVLIVDDSPLMRRLLSSALQADPEIEVIGVAEDPLIAREEIKRLNPDVLTLDIEMPRMDGLSFLRKIMALRPMPVIMVSSLTQAGAAQTLEALEIGAVDVVGKPCDLAEGGLGAAASEIVAKVKAAAAARPRPARALAARGAAAASLASQGGPLAAQRPRLIAIGASTGGVEALRCVLGGLPTGLPPVLIVQHMPKQFTSSFAARLDANSALNVCEAVHGQALEPGGAYLAPGGRHMLVRRRGAGFACDIVDGDLISGHKPSVDVLFRSVSDAVGAAAVGVILTGMGRDGADGLLQMRRAGAATLGQDEASCVVYGMPRSAFQIGAVARQAPLDAIAAAILREARADAAGKAGTARSMRGAQG